MKVFAYIKSLFTDKPQLISKERDWFYRRGKRISEYQLMVEKHTL